MKSIKEYASVGDWFNDAKKEGYIIPLPMCHGIQTAMRELNKNFAEIFELFERNEVIIQEGKVFIYNLMGHKAIKENEK